MTFIKDPERFEKIAAGIQSYLISAAILVGGAWTLYTFSSQLQVQNARAQLTKLQRELEAEPRLEISLDARQLDSQSKDARYVVGTLTVKNVGNGDTSLALDGKPIKIFKVVVDSTGEGWTLVRELGFRSSERATLSGLMCHANSTSGWSFITDVREPGLYVVKFSATRKPDEAAKVVRAGTKAWSNVRIQWATSRYLEVK
jgi:hypothetical protein